MKGESVSNNKQFLLNILIGGTTTAAFSRSVRGAQSGIDSIGKVARRVALGITSAFAAVNLTKGIEEAIETYSDFEQAMANTAAISSASTLEYERMEEAAKAAAETTTKTATEAAQALSYMALAGWSVDESIEGLIPMIKLSEATGEDLQTTSDLVTDSMSALGITVDDMSGYLDMLAESNNDANTTATQLMESLLKTGGAARSLGVDLEDTITATDILANNGLKGAASGTALNSILRRLGSNTTAIKQLDELGVNMWDDDGNFIGLKETITEIDGALNNLTDEEKTTAMSNLAGRYFSQFKYLLAAVEEGADGSASAWDELESSIVDSEGALETMNATMTDTLSASWQRLQNNFDNMKIAIVEVFADDATDFLNGIAEKIPGITESIVGFLEENKGAIYGFLEGVGEALQTLWNIAKPVGEFLLNNTELIGVAIEALIGFNISGKVLNFSKSLITMTSTIPPVVKGMSAAGQAAMGFMSTLQPLILLLEGVGFAALAVYKHLAAVREGLKDDLIAERFGSVAMSLEELEDMADRVVQGNKLTTISNMLDSVGESASALETVEDNLKTINKYNWKISVGVELSEEDYEDYGEALDNYIASVQDYADTKQYEITVALDLLYGDSDTTTDTDSTFKKLNKRITKLGEKIKKAYADSLEDDGIIDEKENEIIQKYVDKLEKVKTIIAQTGNQQDYSNFDIMFPNITGENFSEFTDAVNDSISEANEAYYDAYTAATEAARIEYELSDKTQKDLDAYNAAIEEAKNARNEGVASNYESGMSYVYNRLTEAFPEIEEFGEQYSEKLTSIFQTAFGSDDIAGALNNYLQYGGSDIGEFYDQIAGFVEEIDNIEIGNGAHLSDVVGEYFDPETLETLKAYRQQIVDDGGEVSEELNTLINNYDALAMLANEGNIYSVIGDNLKQSDTYLEDLVALAERGAELPEGIGEDVLATYEAIQEHLPELSGMTEEGIATTLDEFEADPDIETTFELGNIDSALATTKSEIRNRINSTLSGEYFFKVKLNMTEENTPIDVGGHSLQGYATGGIVDQPTYGVFGEAGTEAFIPIDGSAHSINLWQRVGDMLGAKKSENRASNLVSRLSGTSSEASGNVNLTYAPNVTINGNATSEDIQKGLSPSYKDFKKMAQRYEKERQRVSFA